MRDLSLPLSSAAPARWAARPTCGANITKLFGAIIVLAPLLVFVLVVLLADRLIPGPAYPSQTGITGWIE